MALFSRKPKETSDSEFVTQAKKLLGESSQFLDVIFTSEDLAKPKKEVEVKSINIPKP